MRSLDVESPVRQTDRQGDQRDMQTEKGGTKQQNRIRIRSRAHFVFFFLASLHCWLCRLSSVRAAVNRFSAQVTRRITVTRRRRATRLRSRAGELSLNLLTNQYHCQYTRTDAHSPTHTHTRMSRSHAGGCGCVATAHKLWQLKSIN